MKKFYIIMVLCLSIAKSAIAGDGDKYFNISTGWQHPNIVSSIMAYEFETRYNNSWEIMINLTNSYRKCPEHKIIDSRSFWDYQTIAVGVAYKPTIYKWKNSLLKLRGAADLGGNNNSFQASINIGLEYNYTFRSGLKFFILQKNDIVFWARDTFRNGAFIGLKIPLLK